MAKKKIFKPNWDALALTTYKNFTALCYALGYQSAPAGNSKIKLLNSLEARYEYERDGKAYIIKSKKDFIPETKRSNNTKYVELLHEALWRYGIVYKEYSSPGKQYSFTHTRSDWQFQLGMVTSDWQALTSARTRENAIDHLLRLGNSTNDISMFEFEVNRKLYEIFFSFLNSERTHKQATYIRKYMITGWDTSADGDVITETRSATKQETEIIKDTMNELLQNPKYYNISGSAVKTPFFLASDKRQDFYDELSRTVRTKLEELYEVSFADNWSLYSAVRITIKNLPSEKPDEITMRQYAEELAQLRQQIRKMIKEALIDDMSVYYEKLVAKADKKLAEKNASITIGTGDLPQSSVWYPPEDFCKKMKNIVDIYW